MDILSSGDTVSELFLLLSGTAEVISPDPAGSARQAAAVAPQGDSQAQAVPDYLSGDEGGSGGYQSSGSGNYGGSYGHAGGSATGQGGGPAFHQMRGMSGDGGGSGGEANSGAFPGLDTGSYSDVRLNPNSPISMDVSGVRRPVQEGSVLGEAAFFTEVPQLEAVRSLTGQQHCHLVPAGGLCLPACRERLPPCVAICCHMLPYAAMRCLYCLPARPPPSQPDCLPTANNPCPLSPTHCCTVLCCSVPCAGHRACGLRLARALLPALRPPGAPQPEAQGRGGKQPVFC